MMASRAGSALVLIGLIVLMVFLVTLSAGQGDLWLLLAGASLSALGLVVRRRAARLERTESQQFRTLRRLFRRPPEDDS